MSQNVSPFFATLDKYWKCIDFWLTHLIDFSTLRSQPLILFSFYSFKKWLTRKWQNITMDRNLWRYTQKAMLCIDYRLLCEMYGEVWNMDYLTGQQGWAVLWTKESAEHEAPLHRFGNWWIERAICLLCKSFSFQFFLSFLDWLKCRVEKPTHTDWKPPPTKRLVYWHITWNMETDSMQYKMIEI